MKLILEAAKPIWRLGETVTVRLLALNDTYEAVAVDRRLLVGPNPELERPVGLPLPVSVEPAFPGEEQNLVWLQPWCLYGRERTFDGLPAGRLTLHAYLLRQPADALLPQGPAEPDALSATAEPLVLSIEESG